MQRYFRSLLRKAGLGKSLKLSSRQVRFIIYAVVALCILVAWTTTESETSKAREVDDFADHRRTVAESSFVFEEPVVENVTETFDFGDEEHVIVIDLRPDDPTHKYLDPNAKSNVKNIKEALKNEGKNKEVVNGQFRGQYLNHMALSYKGQKKKSKSHGPTISQIRANPHSTSKKKTTRHPYARGHTQNVVYYQSKSGQTSKASESFGIHGSG